VHECGTLMVRNGRLSQVPELRLDERLLVSRKIDSFVTRE